MKSDPSSASSDEDATDADAPGGSDGANAEVRALLERLEHYPVLSKEEEQALTRRIANARTGYRLTVFENPTAQLLILTKHLKVCAGKLPRHSLRSDRNARADDDDADADDAHADDAHADDDDDDDVPADTDIEAAFDALAEHIRENPSPPQRRNDADDTHPTRVEAYRRAHHAMAQRLDDLGLQAGVIDAAFSLMQRAERYCAAPGAPDLLGDQLATAQEFIDEYRQATRELVGGNLRLVCAIARMYTGRNVPFIELVREGVRGLTTAVATFDYTRGYRFATYATWWVRQAMTRAIADAAPSINVPVHLVETIDKLRRARTRLAERLGRDATVDELAADLERSVEDVERILAVMANGASSAAAPASARPPDDATRGVAPDQGPATAGLDEPVAELIGALLGTSERKG